MAEAARCTPAQFQDTPFQCIRNDPAVQRVQRIVDDAPGTVEGLVEDAGDGVDGAREVADEVADAAVDILSGVDVEELTSDLANCPTALDRVHPTDEGRDTMHTLVGLTPFDSAHRNVDALWDDLQHLDETCERNA